MNWTKNISDLENVNVDTVASASAMSSDLHRHASHITKTENK